MFRPESNMLKPKRFKEFPKIFTHRAVFHLLQVSLN